MVRMWFASSGATILLLLLISFLRVGLGLSWGISACFSLVLRRTSLVLVGVRGWRLFLLDRSGFLRYVRLCLLGRSAFIPFGDVKGAFLGFLRIGQMTKTGCPCVANGVGKGIKGHLGDGEGSRVFLHHALID